MKYLPNFSLAFSYYNPICKKINCHFTLFSFLAFFASLFIFSSCSSSDEFEKPKEIAEAIKNLPKEWFLLTEKEGRKILIDPYEGMNPTFKFEYDLGNENMQIRYQANLTQRTWLVQKLIKDENTYTFYLLENGGNTTTRLTYSQTTHPAVGNWKEPSAVFLPYKNTFFTWDKQPFEKQKQQNTAISTQWERGEWLRMKGTIEGKEYSLWAYICVTADVSAPQFQRGVYFYDTFWRDIYLENASDYKNSSITKENEKIKWVIEERAALDAENISGHFQGSVDYDYNFKGVWESAKTNQKLDFLYKEKILPYSLENHIKHFKTSDGSSLCIYYPQITGIENEDVLKNFNETYIKSHVNAWQKEFLAKIDTTVSQNRNCDIEINYNILFANKNLISGLFFMRQGSKRTEYVAFNYDLKKNEVFRLNHLFDTEIDKKNPQNSFEARIHLRAKRHVEVESQRHQMEFEPYDSLTVLEHYNFLPDNLRLTLYSRSQKRFFPIYIPYKDLRAYIKERERRIYLELE